MYKRRMHCVMRCTNVARECSIMSIVKREGREKIKEKMKRQRLSGQSGIGEDFRRWRSDEEMVMRQQYM